MGRNRPHCSFEKNKNAMKNILTLMLSFLCLLSWAQGQEPGVKTTDKTYRTSEGLEIAGQEGYLTVLENRNNPKSRLITVKFIRLRSLAASPTEPVVFLEGGGSTVTWQAESPKDLHDWVPVLKVADLIFIDQRGNGKQDLNYIEMGGFPADFFNTEHAALDHYQKMIKSALPYFAKNNIDYLGYTIEAHAEDLRDITRALNIDRFNLIGFSFGSSIGMATMMLYPEVVERAVLVGADAPHQSLNFPAHLDAHIEKISRMVKADKELSQQIPSFKRLVESTLDQLEKKPLEVNVRNPLNGQELSVKLGRFGLALLLRLDIDDANDIPVMPRLVYDVSRGDTRLLSWFLQKRLPYALAIPANGLNQGIASGVSDSRWKEIEHQAEVSPYGHLVNFPFDMALDHWPEIPMKLNTAQPIRTSIPTLFVTGDLDARTPVVQVEETRKGFTHASHVIVKNAGHEQTLWNAKVFDELIPAFLKGETVNDQTVSSRAIRFIPLTGDSEAHPAFQK